MDVDPNKPPVAVGWVVVAGVDEPKSPPVVDGWVVTGVAVPNRVLVPAGAGLAAPNREPVVVAG